MHVAALPHRLGQQLRDGSLQSRMVIADHKLHPSQSAPFEPRDKLLPARARFAIPTAASFRVGSGGVINNLAQGTFDFQSDFDIINGGGGTFNNFGTVTKTEQVDSFPARAPSLHVCRHRGRHPQRYPDNGISPSAKLAPR